MYSSKRLIFNDFFISSILVIILSFSFSLLHNLMLSLYLDIASLYKPLISYMYAKL